MYCHFELKLPGYTTKTVPIVFVWANKRSGSWRLMNRDLQNLVAWDDTDTFTLHRDKS